MSDRRLRVLYLLYQYPQLSQSYVKVELEHVSRAYDVAVTARREGPDRYAGALPCTIVPSQDIGPLREIVEDFRPDVLHAHWLKASPALTVARLAEATGVPFTVRSHSFDVLWGGPKGDLFDRGLTLQRLLPDWLRAVIARLNTDLCLGVLGFPFARRRLERAGLRPEKFHATFPVVDVERFADRSPNGDGVMSCGVVNPKKAAGNFIDLAQLVPQRAFRFYALGAARGSLAMTNKAAGGPIEVVPPVEHDDMPREYKRHEWLLYTGSKEKRSVGWPVAVAEAQASGVGVVMPRLRPDIAEYVGDAGYLYDSFDEAASIISKPFPEEKRELGFELATRSDIRGHLPVLTDLWAAHATRPTRRVA